MDATRLACSCFVSVDSKALWFVTQDHLCSADIPNPWNTREALIDGIFGLTADQIQAINIYINFSGNYLYICFRTDQCYRRKVDNPMAKFCGQSILEKPENRVSMGILHERMTSHMKHPNPNRIDPNEDATSSTLTPN